MRKPRGNLTKCVRGKLTDLKGDELVGVELESNFSGTFTVMEYLGKCKYKLIFTKTGYITVRCSSDITRGVIHDPLYPHYFGVACLGAGKYQQREHKAAYTVWNKMTGRCYDPKNNRFSRYGERGITVCDEWLNFQNFAVWYYANMKIIGNIRFQLDKDLLCKGNKQYSPEFCTFIPSELNTFFTACNKMR